MLPKAANGPTHVSGIIVIQGIISGSIMIADSPESAWFFEATKKIHANKAVARSRNKPAAVQPPGESLSIGFSILSLALSLAPASAVPPE